MTATLPERRPATEQISGVIELALARWVSTSLFLERISRGLLASYSTQKET
jgi:hypothetical protein